VFEVQQALDLFYLAVKYNVSVVTQVDKLKQVCEFSIEHAISTDNAPLILKRCASIDATQLVNFCKEFIYNNFGQVIGKPTFA
jgi:hypothetical protein